MWSQKSLKNLAESLRDNQNAIVRGEMVVLSQQESEDLAEMVEKQIDENERQVDHGDS